MTGLKVLSVVLDTKLSFESNISLIAASASSKLGILRKACVCFDNRSFFVGIFGVSCFQS